MRKQHNFIKVYFDEQNQPFDSTMLAAFDTVREGTTLSKSACASRLMTLGALMMAGIDARSFIHTLRFGSLGELFRLEGRLSEMYPNLWPAAQRASSASPVEAPLNQTEGNGTNSAGLPLATNENQLQLEARYPTTASRLRKKTRSNISSLLSEAGQPGSAVGALLAQRGWSPARIEAAATAEAEILRYPRVGLPLFPNCLRAALPAPFVRHVPLSTGDTRTAVSALDETAWLKFSREDLDRISRGVAKALNNRRQYIKGCQQLATIPIPKLSVGCIRDLPLSKMLRNTMERNGLLSSEKLANMSCFDLLTMKTFASRKLLELLSVIEFHNRRVVQDAKARDLRIAS